MKWKTYEFLHDEAVNLLGWAKENWEHLQSPIDTMMLELSLLKMFVRAVSYQEEFECDWHLRFTIENLKQMNREFVKDMKGVRDHNQCLNLEVVMYDFRKTIDVVIRTQMRDACLLLLGGAYKCTSCPGDHKGFGTYGRDTASVIQLIRQNISALCNSDLIDPLVKQHIALVQGRLEDFGTFVDPVGISISTEMKVPSELVSRARTWSTCISCLTVLYWIDGKDEMGAVLYSLLHKTVQGISGVIASNFTSSTLIHQLLASYFDFLLEDLVTPVKDDVRTIHERLLFLLSFVMDPPEDDSEDRGMILAQVYAVINKFPSLTYSTNSGVMEGRFRGANYSDLLLESGTVMENARKLYLVTPYTTQYNSPVTNATGFLYSLTADLKRLLKEKEKNFPIYLKSLYELVLKELVSLRPLLENMVELLEDGEHEEIHDLWKKVVNMVYNADYFIKLSYLRSGSSWYGLIALPYVRELMENMKIEMNNLVVMNETQNKKLLSDHNHMEGDVALQPRSTTSDIEIVSVGFIEDEKLIIDKLKGGRSCLTIISISGLGGQGKTSIAKRIYNNLNVQCYFKKTVWCYVSKDCSVKDLLVQILSGGDGNQLSMKNLDERVRQSLKRRRYLIVMDDIWDVEFWDQLVLTLPDDKNGSRILFTSRIHDLGAGIYIESVSHCLPLFSDEESWELMKKRVFGSDECNCEEFERIGKEIAGYCKGLPLAVVMASAALTNTVQSLESWNKVAENLKTHGPESYGKVLELSYNYLPDHMKSCFLYFGAFLRGEEVRAKELKLLWMSEGLFITDGETRCLEDLATKYLNDLVSQGLVVVTERGSMGGIKRCNVHDLLYDLCLDKCKESNFFLNWAVEEKQFSVWDEYEYDRKRLPEYDHHRLRINSSDPFIKTRPIATSRRRLPTSSVHTLLWWNNGYSDRYLSLQFLENFKLLTVLKADLQVFVPEFPKEILSNIYLRYLALYFQNGLGEVPRTIANLWKLETLLINTSSGSRQVLLPESIWDMNSFRHFHVKDVCKLKPGILFGGASDIETLGTLRLNEDYYTTAEFLQNFPRLRKFRCKLIGRLYDVLKLFSMVESLLQKLESLSVIHRGGRVHRYPRIWNIPRNENLNKLTLERVWLPWSDLSELGKHLPNLQVLKLAKNSNEAYSWGLKDGDFSKLVYLKLCQLEVRKVDIFRCDDSTPFPSLEHLVLDTCQYLKEIPSIFEEVNCLKTITVTFCPIAAKESAKRIQEQQREYGNDSLQVKFGDTYGDIADEDEDYEVYEDEDDGDDEAEEDDEDDRGN